MSEKKEGSLRLLTLGELRMAKTVFEETIHYNRVWIHHDSYLPFGLQNRDTAMTPNGELYFRNWYTSDFSVADYPSRHLFIHEMGHVWQRERGMSIIVRGLVSFAVSYRYRLDGRPLRRYPMEQQAQIIADNFILNSYGYTVWMILRRRGDVTLEGDLNETVIRKKYLETMRNFPWG